MVEDARLKEYFYRDSKENERNQQKIFAYSTFESCDMPPESQEETHQRVPAPFVSNGPDG
jgi:hypothetical protein